MNCNVLMANMISLVMNMKMGLNTFGTDSAIQNILLYTNNKIEWDNEENG